MTAPEAEDWPAVVGAVRARMRELRMSTAALARESGLSETTVRYLGQSLAGHNKATLVALAAVLRWRHDHLVNILHREPGKNVHVKRRTEDDLRRVFREEAGPIKEQLRALTEAVNAVSRKLHAEKGRT